MVATESTPTEIAEGMAEQRGELVRANLANAWIDYPRALQVLNALNDLLRHPKIERMPNLAVIGETNNGKSTLLSHFIRMHTREEVLSEESTHLPILRIDTPAQPDEWRLYDNILRALFSHGPRRENVESQLDRITKLFGRLDIKMLVLDEFSNALAGSGNRQKAFLNALKNLGNRLRIPIVIAGLPECLSALASDPQLMNRFKPMDLPTWRDPAQYARLLRSMEPQLGLLKPCDFMNKRVVQSLLHATEGLIGETAELLSRLTQAVVGGTEIIGLDQVTPEALSAIDWVRPSDRPRYAARR